MNPDTDVRRQRRALREEVFQRFVEAIGAGRPFRGLTGSDRLVLYTLAANTGFRAGELASLTPVSFDLEAESPSVTVQAAYSKRRRKDVQPLRADTAAMMRQYIAAKPRQQPIWPGNWKIAAAEMVRFDLAARHPLPRRIGPLNRFPRHARPIHQLPGNRRRSSKVAQVLARHSSITLTMDFYTHLDVLDVHGALDKLPAAQGAGKAPEASKHREHA